MLVTDIQTLARRRKIEKFILLKSQFTKVQGFRRARGLQGTKEQMGAHKVLRTSSRTEPYRKVSLPQYARRSVEVITWRQFGGYPLAAFPTEPDTATAQCLSSKII